MGERGEATGALATHGDDLRHIVKTDADPRVRQRGQALLLVAEGHPVAAVARLLHVGPNRIRAWRARFLAEGRTGLTDRPRRGRPPKLDAADYHVLQAALDSGPRAYGLPITVWSIRDLRALLARERGVAVSAYTVHRAVHTLGYRYRRPRHDLTHRQDGEAVAAAEQVLRWLQKKALLSPNDCIWSTWTSARSIPIPTWRRSGVDAASR
jgi:transposase